MAHAAVNWLSPSALDAFEGAISAANIICEDEAGSAVMSGDRFPVGTTTVTCRANDTALNEGTGQFNITVVGRYRRLCLGIGLFLWLIN